MNVPQKNKGPASVGALPDHGSTKSVEGMEMNTNMNTITAPDRASPSIYGLIAQYWLAYDILMNAQEEEGTDAEIAACLHLNAAEIAICAFVPTRLSEARLKADFVTRLASENKGNLETRCTAALLSTLPALYVQEVAA